MNPEREAYIEIESTLKAIQLNTESPAVFEMTEKALEQLEYFDPDKMTPQEEEEYEQRRTKQHY